MNKLRPPRHRGQFQGYANGGRVLSPGEKIQPGKGEASNGTFVKSGENPTSADLDAVLKSNRNPLYRERRGPQ